MRFVRVSVNHDSGEVIGVVQQDTPFESGGECIQHGARCETFDLGVVEEQEWRNEDGHATHAARHIHVQLRASGISAADIASGKVTAQHAGVALIHDCPCTLPGIEARVRARGPAGIPAPVRAWLVNALPDDVARRLGLGRGISTAALLKAESARAARDPRGGHRLEQLRQALKSETAERLARSRSGHG